MKRWSSPSAVTMPRLVEPTSVTTTSSPLAASASRASSTKRETGAAQTTTSAPSHASATDAAARLSAPTPTARATVSGSGSKPTTMAPSMRDLAARPIEPPIRPTPRIAILIARAAP